MNITIYELLGLIKDGKTPKLIKFKSIRYEWIDNVYVRFDEDEEHYLDMDFGLAHFLNDEVEILEEQKEIPEKLDRELNCTDDTLRGLVASVNEIYKEIADKINEIIDYLESKGE